MSNQIVTTNGKVSQMESAAIVGDLSKLSPDQRMSYYMEVCKSTGLNPLTRPFDYITLNGKLTLYARKDASEQLRKINGISIDKPDISYIDDWIVVTVSAHDGNGRSDSDIGVVSKKDMRGDFGNALMKAITKAKRRVTLSICGLGWLDETEVETFPDAKRVVVDDSGVIVQPTPRPETVVMEELGYDPMPEPEPMPVKQAAPVNLTRPLDPDTLRQVFTNKTEKMGEYQASDKQRNFLRILLEQVFAGNDDKYRAWLWFVFDATSSKDLTGAQVKAVLDWLKPTQDSGGAWVIDPMAEKEAAQSASSAMIERAVADGQQTLI